MSETPRVKAVQPADEAVSAVLLAQLDIIRAQFPGALAGRDPVPLHYFRIAVRRSRALQKDLAGVFEPRLLGEFRDEFRILQRLTGPARDADVQIEMVEREAREYPDLAPVLDVLRERRFTVLENMRRGLRAENTMTLLEDWESLLRELPELSPEDRPDAGLPIAQLVNARVLKLHKKILKHGAKIDDDSPAQALHDLRKLGKRLRYLLEVFEELYPGKTVKPMLASLKSLQDSLGRFHDDAVQAEQLRSLADDLVFVDHGAATLIALGALIERLDADLLRARGEFDERFRAFASKDQRKLVKKAFG